jgi:sodium-dependent dicarboxylate transporter 2/3/5
MKQLRQKLFVIAGPLAALSFYYGIELDPNSPEITATAAIAIWMALWWLSEAVPLSVTSLLPVVFFPALGIMDGKEISQAYINHIIFLFIGGFLVALAIQDWGLHKRIAYKILSIFGKSHNLILLGFMITTAFLSMWISNTATVMMMVPVVMAIILNLEERFGKEQTQAISTAYLLAIAYSASIGGIATLIGTPPNLSFARILDISFPNAPEISFANWMILALPVSIIMFIACWYLLHLMYLKKSTPIHFERDHFKDKYQALGKASFEQKIISLIFCSMALLWMFRNDINLGVVSIPGWSAVFTNPKYFNDGTVAIFMALILFLIPNKDNTKRLLNESAFSRLPWHIILLFGGGFALATGFIESGLSLYLAETLGELKQPPILVIIGSICFLITFLTELSSNTATTEMFLPILASMSVALDVNPLILMIPATLSASCAFMLPVATPPNAIIFSTNRLHIYQMAKTGIFLNILGIAIITSTIYFAAPIILDFQIYPAPEWAALP